MDTKINRFVEYIGIQVAVMFIKIVSFRNPENIEIEMLTNIGMNGLAERMMSKGWNLKSQRDRLSILNSRRRTLVISC